MFQALFCSILVGFPLWLAMFVVPACWLACFAARWSVGACGCMCTHSHVHSLFIPSSIQRVLFLVSSGLFCQGVFIASYSFFVTMVNILMPRSTFNRLAAGFILSSSSQSTSLSSADPAAVLPSMANVSQVAALAASTTVVLPSTALPLFLPDTLPAAVAQAIGNTLPAIVPALQSSNSQPVSPVSLPPCWICCEFSATVFFTDSDRSFWLGVECR